MATSIRARRAGQRDQQSQLEAEPFEEVWLAPPF